MTTSSIRLLHQLMFDVPPEEYSDALAEVRRDMGGHVIAGGTTAEAVKAAALIAENYVDMDSYLADLNLKDSARFGSRALTDGQLGEEMTRSYEWLQTFGNARLCERTKHKREAVLRSNLLKLARGADDGTHSTRWGNDYASGLRDAMQKGAILVTTNPVLIGLAAAEAPEVWTPVRDEIRAAHPKAKPEEIAALLTIKVVVGNARLLRPIWEISGRHLGYVSLQLSPKDAFDADVMIQGATQIYEGLCEEMGGVPNTVFKVPGTKAGIEVAAELTRRGIGVNVTVSFSLPQQIAFAGAIESCSTAPLSFRTQMDGRVDDPIGEELEAEGVADWEEVKTWATTAIRQREYRLLSMLPQDGGLGLARSFSLGASGRGPWNILRSICNGPRTMFITVFPNRQVEFDAEPRELRPEALWDEVPADRLAKLQKSRLFRQAFEPDGMTPEEFGTYLPVQRTLKQFAEGYDNFVAWCAGQRDKAA